MYLFLGKCLSGFCPDICSSSAGLSTQIKKTTAQWTVVFVHQNK